MKHLGTKTLKTERLILRKIELKDAQDLYEIVTDKDVIKWLTIPIYTGVDMAIDYISNKLSKKYDKQDYYDWGIVLKENNKLIGRICVYRQDDDRRMADLVWFINGKYSNKGYITEGAKTIITFLKKLGFERIEAFANPDNKASIKVMEKLGMQYEGLLKKYDCMRDNTLYDAVMHSIT